jgi:hypothetical protein
MMTTSSVSFAYGNVSFAAEAENENWLTDQLDKFLELAKNLPQPASMPSNKKTPPLASGCDEKFTGTLASHLREKEATTNQVKRFLATADWLRRRGNDRLNTGAVAKALNDNQQSRLSNPSESLNKNVAKGC